MEWSEGGHQLGERNCESSMWLASVRKEVKREQEVCSKRLCNLSCIVELVVLIRVGSNSVKEIEEGVCLASMRKEVKREKKIL